MGCGGSKLLRSNRVSSSFTRKISPLPEQASGNEASVEDHSRERTDHEDENHDTSPSLCKIKKDPRVESLKRQLRQLAEELARFEAWCLEEGESSSSKEERDDPLLERDKDSLDQFEDFTSKVPVYDEDPSDLLQEKPISPLSIESGGSDKAEFDQTPRWRSKSRGREERNIRIPHLLREGKIRKNRRRKMKASKGRSLTRETR